MGTTQQNPCIGVGSDDFGAFEVERGFCPKCEFNGLNVHYKEKMRLEEYVRKAPSLIINCRRSNRIIGLTCGCYAKFHRQVAHIRNGGKS